ncbi:phosphoribosylaminoimidazolesuccinocarboxamide synthase [Litorivicinus lipolyticus]|uniref:Phosphoribosylaminoimidazole-succinocarboxamide synthase n=1 Tax=Litorivicinus lipolyticus TaxID=418701 RepID=A0A5Q2QG86_9GAMM|nr:phosphoribosylaminoimidazolesuccinocarboxamide synthase [Litorivicinus lipolyticus]QGG80015.1 phosphoribosylaminoimidazolesuccinocarboxamide synthase [Litorivicinus lipolyticus]
MDKLKALYEGKAKTAWETADPNYVVMEFRNDTSAFDGGKTASLARKGLVNSAVDEHVMTALSAAGIETHFERRIDANNVLVKRLQMLPVECVVRNRASGSIVRRLGVEDGATLAPPVFELFLKNDELHDPMINASHCVTFGWASAEQLAEMEALTLQVNAVLAPMFLAAGMILVDYKLEFGLFEGRMVLGDEFSPDGCRLWDATTLRKLDKDVFRQDLGDLVESYQEVATRLGVVLP